MTNMCYIKTPVCLPDWNKKHGLILIDQCGVSLGSMAKRRWKYCA